MRKLFTAALLIAAVSLTSIAVADQVKPILKPGEGVVIAQTEPVMEGPPDGPPSLDARSVASDREVGEARRGYRAACQRYESAGFCECITAGVAQALPPADVRMAARTIGERITAQGDAAVAESSDPAIHEGSSMMRIEQVEGHYADACASYRR